MVFQNVAEALRALEDVFAGPSVHQEAIRYLASLDDCDEAESLVQALQSDDPGVRWEAGNLLAKMGEKAIPAVLKALMDPKRVGDPRLRVGVEHMIHRMPDHTILNELSPLVKAINGPSADVETMQEAYRLLKKMDPNACIERKEEDE